MFSDPPRDLAALSLGERRRFGFRGNTIPYVLDEANALVHAQPADLLREVDGLHEVEVYVLFVQSQLTRDTTPWEPLTRTRSPSCSAVRAPWTAITAGTPTSRAVTAPCESGPPLSVTTATAE